MRGLKLPCVNDGAAAALGILALLPAHLNPHPEVHTAMANQSERHEPVGRREPVGFTPHSSGLASERAREQGWQTNEEERTRMAQGKQNEDGGTDYDYGARDFGDEPVDTSAGTSAGTSSGTSSATTPESSAGISRTQPSPGTAKKEKTPATKPRSKKAA